MNIYLQSNYKNGILANKVDKVFQCKQVFLTSFFFFLGFSVTLEAGLTKYENKKYIPEKKSNLRRYTSEKKMKKEEEKDEMLRIVI